MKPHFRCHISIMSGEFPYFNRSTLQYLW